LHPGEGQGRVRHRSEALNLDSRRRTGRLCRRHGVRHRLRRRGDRHRHGRRHRDLPCDAL